MESDKKTPNDILIDFPFEPDIELRSDEVQEIMGHIPPWILRHGINLLFIVVIILLIGSWFFKYPDVIPAQITVTSIEPPANTIARSTGKIDTIYVKNNEVVTANMPLAVIQNSANTADMLLLIKIMKKWAITGYSDDIANTLFETKPLRLGEIQNVYATFLSSLNDYRNYKTLNYFPKKINYQTQQLKAQHEYHSRILRQKEVIFEQFQTSQNIFRRDSILLVKNIISSNEYDISKNSFLQSKQAFLTFNASLKQSEMHLLQGEENLLDLQQQAIELERKYFLALQNSAEVLNTQIKSWEHTFLMVSPIDGIVTQMGVWSNNQNVNVGETIFSVSPQSQDKPKGKALLPIQGAGKVKPGQRVNVRINNFPDQEFGYLIGQIESVSNIPNAEGFYIVEIFFPEGMKTNYGQILPISREMRGQADIITSDLRLIERIFLPIKKIIKNQEY